MKKIKKKYSKLKNSKIEINYSLKKLSWKQRFEELPQSKSFRKTIPILMTQTPSNSPEKSIPNLEKEPLSPNFGTRDIRQNNSFRTQILTQPLKKRKKPKVEEKLIHSLSKSPIDNDISMFSPYSNEEDEQDAQPPSDVEMQTASPSSQGTVPSFPPSPPITPPHLIKKSN